MESRHFILLLFLFFTVIKFNLVVDKYFDNIINVILVFPFSPTTLIRLDRCLPELIAFVLGGSDLGELRRSRTIVHIYYSSMNSPADYI